MTAVCETIRGSSTSHTLYSIRFSSFFSRFHTKGYHIHFSAFSFSQTKASPNFLLSRNTLIETQTKGKKNRKHTNNCSLVLLFFVCNFYHFVFYIYGVALFSMRKTIDFQSFILLHVWNVWMLLRILKMLHKRSA